MSMRPRKVLETISHKKLRLEDDEQDALSLDEQIPAEDRKQPANETETSSSTASSTPQEQQQQQNTDDDTFAWCLRCQTVSDPQQQSVVWWLSPARPVPTAVELALTPILVPYKSRERGMFKTQSGKRLRQVQHACREHRIPISSALSLRRHLMRQYNPHVPMARLGLGKFEDVIGAARVFEESVQKELVKLTVEFYAEEEQKRYIQEHKQPEMPFPPTPDFILKKSVLVKKYFMRHQKRRVVVERSINCTLKVELQLSFLLRPSVSYFSHYVPTHSIYQGLK